MVLVKTNDLDACRHSLFQQIERAGDVGIDEVLPAVGADMRLVQRGGVKDHLHASHATPDARAVGDRADVRGERTIEDVEADDVVPELPQGADQRLAEVTGTSCDQDPHDGFHSRALRPCPCGVDMQGQTLPYSLIPNPESRIPVFHTSNLYFSALR